MLPARANFSQKRRKLGGEHGVGRSREAEMVLGHPLSCVILCQGRTGKRASRLLRQFCEIVAYAFHAFARFRSPGDDALSLSMLKGSQPSVRDVDVLGDCSAASANTTDNLAIDHDRDTAAKQSEARLL